MKKLFYLKRFFIAAAFMLVLSVLTACTGYSGKHDGFYGNLDIKVSNFKLSAYAGAFYWDGTKADLQITVPDKFKGAEVGRLGGHFGTGVPDPFRIEMQTPFFELRRNGKLETMSDEEKAAFLKDSPLNRYFTGYGYPDKSKYDVPFTVEELAFKLSIGRYVKKLYIEDITNYIGFRRQDKSIVFYLPVFDIECSPDNEVFYSKDGRLYKRADSSLITDFRYPGALQAEKEKAEAERAAAKEAGAGEAGKAAEKTEAEKEAEDKALEERGCKKGY